MSELLLTLELDSEQQEYADIIYRSSIALLQVLNDVLDFSRIEARKLNLENVAFPLCQVAYDVHKMFAFTASITKKAVDFIFDSSSVDSGLTIIGDPGRLRQIIINLLSNSFKFTTNGLVSFRMACDIDANNLVTAKFVVEDSRIGISNDVRDKLFQPFSQGDASTARRFGGTGLGLTICKNLLDLMGGRIELESEVGRGTKVTF
jgi:signal transduction histidine kinase